jgi:hypothetical protein
MTTTTAAPRHAAGPARGVPSPPPRPGARRGLEVARAAWGAALLIGPRLVLEHIHGVRADSRSIAVARVLGARHVAQAALSGIRPAPAVLALGVWADTAHAGTALILTIADHARARAAMTDAAVAAGWALAGFRELTRNSAPRPADEPRRDQLARSVLRHLPAGRPLLTRAASP